ncbi:MAG: hypothetical protein RR590_00465 [Hungatella sp.]
MKINQLKKQLSAAYRYSWCRLALNYYSFYDAVCDSVEEENDAQIFLDEFQQILRNFLNHQAGLEELEELRNQMIQKVEIVVAYVDCFQIYEYVFNRMERRFTDGVKITESPEDFTTHLMSFILSSPDAFVMNSRIQQVISQLPIRYTRQKFYSLLCDGLSVYIGSDKKSLNDRLYLLRTESMVQLPEAMKDDYPELFERLNQLEQLNYLKLEKTEYQTGLDHIHDAAEELNDLADIYDRLQEMINDLYVLFLAQDFALVDVSENKICQEIVSRVLKELLEGNTSMVEDEITDMLYDLEGKQEAAMEDYLSVPLQPAQLNDPMGEALVKIDKLLSTSPFVNLKETAETEALVERSDVEQAVAAFREPLDLMFSKLSKPVSRAIMAKVLSDLPVIFGSTEALETYILGSLEGCSDWAERETCMELLNQMMEMEDALV